MTTLNPILVVAIVFGLIFVIFNSLSLGLSIPIGELIAHFFENWLLALLVLVINFIILPILAIGFVLLLASSMPGELKLGFCVVALGAGAPFAPVLTRVAKGNVNLSVMMMIVLMVVTFIVLPFALPPVVSAVDPSVTVSAWGVAWPLLLFMLAPMVIGILFRLRWPDVALQGAHLFGPITLTCLLVHLCLFIFAFWGLFASAWGTEAYIAALAFPFIAILCGYILVSLLRIKDLGTRHACEITTGQRNLSASILVAIFPLGAYPLVSVSVLSIQIIAILVVLVFSMEWARAQAQKGAEAKTAVASESA